MVSVPVEVHSDYNLHCLLISGRSYSPSLYTAIARNDPLRTRILCFSSELDVFWWHFRQAHDTLFGWLSASVLLILWYTFVSAFTPSLSKILSLSNRFFSLIPSLQLISGVPTL